MENKPINITSDRKTWADTSNTGESVELKVHDLDALDIGVNIQNHPSFSTLTIMFGNVKVTCFSKIDHVVNDDDICTTNLQLIDTLLNKLMDVEHDLRMALRDRNHEKLDLISTGVASK